MAMVHGALVKMAYATLHSSVLQWQFAMENELPGEVRDNQTYPSPRHKPK